MRNKIKGTCCCGQPFLLTWDDRFYECRCGALIMYEPSISTGKDYGKDKKKWKEKKDQ